MKKISILVLLVGLVACAASGPRFTQSVSASSDAAIIYLYRPGIFFQGGVSPDIYINDKFMFKMLNAGFDYVELPPGNYVISPRKNASWVLDVSDTKISVEAGKVYYLKLLLSNTKMDFTIVGQYGTGSVSGSTQFVIVDSQFAKSELIKTKKIQ